MFYVGEVSVKKKNLVTTTYESMMKGISTIRSGIHLGNIGEAIQTYVEGKGFPSLEIFVVMELEKYFMNFQIYYIMEKKVKELNYKLA